MYKFTSTKDIKTYHTYVQIYVNKGHLEKRITHMYKFTKDNNIYI